MLADHLRPVAAEAGYGRIGWHTFRHSFTSWGKKVLKIDETKELARHADIATSSNIYGGLSLESKREAQGRLVEFVLQAAKKPPEKAAS
jgi:integrase